MKYLVLGSAGQIGEALVSKIKATEGNEVLEFDLENHPSQDLRINKNELLDRLVNESDFVFFLAFDVGGSRYLATYQNTYDFVSNNIKILDQTFDVLKKYNKPFIFASSQMANMSYSSYGLLKSVGEKTTEILGGIVVKFWNVYGLEHDKNKFHVITDLIIKAAKTGVIDLMTDGTEERQFLYADDCSECLIELSKRYDEIPRDKQLHVTNFEWTNILNVASIISSHFPNSTVVPATSKDEVQKNKRNEPDEFILNYWKPKTILTDGIAHIISEMQKSPEKYPGMPLV
jgi:nucleoside-diphosphate-sugar epimerase